MSAQFIFLVLGTGLFSTALALIYWCLDCMGIHHRHRLFFVKTGLILTGLVPFIAIAFHAIMSNRAIGTLLPEPGNMGKRLSQLKAAVAFSEQGSHFWHLPLAAYLVGVGIMTVRLLLALKAAKKLLSGAQETIVNGHLIYKCENIVSPLSFGFWRPRIFAPAHFLESQDRDAIEMALTHEESHIAKNDNRWMILSLFAKVVLFFTPSAHYLHRKLELEMEIECDRITLTKTKSGVQRYGALLLEFAESMSQHDQCSVFAYMSNSTLRRRIVAMKTNKTYRPVVSFALGVVAIAASIGAVAAASGTTAKLKSQFKVKTEILIGGKVVSSPRFVIIADEPASLEMKSTDTNSALRMMLTASDSVDTQVPNGISLKFALEYLGQNRAVRANPHVVVAPGEEATVTLASDSNDNVEMHVTAERQ